MEEPGWFKQPPTPAAKSLNSLRKQIDELDCQLTHLLSQRLLLAQALTAVKSELGIPTQDCRREQEILDKLSRQSSDEQITSSLLAIYDSILSQSRQLQQKASANNRTISASDENPHYFPVVLIIGLGLIGGSLARQIKRCLPHTKILVVDKVEVLELAQQSGIIYQSSDQLQSLLPQANLVVLAANPEDNLQLLQEMAPHLKDSQLVIDVTSCKSHICQVADDLNLQGADFIGGHPLFGSEKTGFSNSETLGIDGKTFCLTPGKKSAEISMRRLVRWLNMLNLQVEITSATTHDVMVARLSHLVQILSVALGAEIADTLSDAELSTVLKLSGTSLQQLSRLMSSPEKMWLEIIADNRENIKDALQSYIARLTQLKTAIELGDDRYIADCFQQASRIPEAFS